MVFGLLKKVAGGAAREVSAEYSGNRDFLEGCCAAAAIIAAADGDIETSEVSEITKLLTNHATLGKTYSQRDIEECAQTMLKRATTTSGKLALNRELDDIKGRQNAAQMAEDIYAIALDVSLADGEVEEAEAAKLKQLAAKLGVDASKFDL